MADITQFLPHATIHLHRHDLPPDLDLGPVIAVDTETMGLDPRRDRLCLIQLSAGDGQAHLVQLIPPRSAAAAMIAPTSRRCWPIRHD